MIGGMTKNEKSTVRHLIRKLMNDINYLELDRNAKVNAGYEQFKLFDKKRNPLYKYKLKKRFAWILKGIPNSNIRFVLNRRGILKMRKNDPVKVIYKKLRDGKAEIEEFVTDHSHSL